jgi:hypothetical protein
MGYLIKKAVQQIVTAKVTLTPANLLAVTIIDIPEYPRVDNFYWQVLSMNGHITGGTLPYVGTSTVHVQASTANTSQFRFGGGYLQSAINTWQFAQINSNPTNGILFVANDNLQIHVPVALTIGNSNLDLYLTAILIPL